MKRETIIYNELALQTLIGELRREWTAEGYLRCTYSTDKPRTLPQNALIYSLYGQISRESGKESVQEVRRRCKLHCGVPILRAEDEEFRTHYDMVLKPLQYPHKLIAMDYWPVTSRMNTSQLSAYVAAIEATEMQEARAVA